MVRIYIADDNELFRQSLIQMAPWEAFDCELVGAAGDGESAYQEIIRLMPDIILLDIQMPGMNGLEIAASLQKRNYKGKIILITGYSDFGYAQKGIRVGVFDYLLKPVDEGELRSVLGRAIRELEESGNTGTSAGAAGGSGSRKTDEPRETVVPDIPSGPAEVPVSYPEQMNLLFQKILGKEEGEAAGIASEMERISQNQADYERFEILRVSRDGETDHPAASENAAATQEWTEQVRTFFDDSVNRGKDMAAFYAADPEILYVLLLFRRYSPEKNYDISTLRLADEVIRQTGEKGIPLTVSISSCHQNFTELKTALQEAEFSHDSRFFVENRRIIHYNSLRSRSISNLYPIMLKEEAYFKALRENPEKGKETLDELQDMFRDSDVADYPMMRNILMNIAIMTDTILAEYKKRSADTEGLPGAQSAVEEVRSAASVNDAFDILRKYVVKISVQAGKGADHGQREAALKIQSYLQQHYTEHITLQDVCDYVGFSQGHVCRILKNELNETFINMLNEIRVEEARKMLSTHQYKVYEVAEKTGFTNYAYFYQTYRKYTGEAPTKR